MSLKNVILIHGEKDFKKFRGKGSSNPKEGNYLFRQEMKTRGKSFGNISEYSVGKSIILRCTTPEGLSFIENLLNERKIDYTLHNSSAYDSICMQEFSKDS